MEELLYKTKEDIKMSELELENTLRKAVYYYFQGLSAHEAINKAVEEMRYDYESIKMAWLQVEYSK